MKQYKEHPLASIFPMMPDAELRELADDIKQNGQRAPIYLLEGKILDGRNRFKACGMVGVEPKFRDFNGNGDPLTFVISANVHRRHLTESQRGLIAAKLADLQRGGDRKTEQAETGKTVAQAAKELNVSERTVKTAKKVLNEAPPEDVKAVEQGEKTVSAVAKEIKTKTEKAKEHFDKTGYPIPSEILEDWRAAESFNEYLKQLHKIKLAVETAIEKSDLSFREITNATTAHLKNAWSDLQRVLPHAVCPTCNGRNRKKCSSCKGRGFVSKFGYERWFAKEVIELREKAIKAK